ncbi:uncharacterized protein LOC130993219 isoform X2 [Salvia miltiorrhiza]|uniref:uncharacterized protein LOC130993219 isoform X2 n=1 Tax=Salvia miltiorrhiza TaxID=226208 RepID=UPI0025AC1378|nr:uncharacterized protein LOC130993219 isoform X2 [Salvia miltiorrhiza]
MAGEFNPGFHHQGALYKSGGGGMSSSSSAGSGGYDLIPMANYYTSPGGTLNLGAVDSSAGAVQYFSPHNNSAGPSSSSLLLDSVPGLKHDTGLAVEWSVEEQYKLEEGLAKYANEPHILQYIKIAASLHDKTVRDVALRCRWMMRKRRKQEDPSLGKKMKDMKDKLMEASVKTKVSSAPPVNLPAYSLPSIRHNQSDYIFSGVLSSGARHLLEENNHAFGQISANLSTLKLQENIDLFFRTRNNLTTVLNDIKNMPGIMSQMPPLPVVLNEELVCSIFPHSSQCMTFGASSSIPLKQEPGC